jgi:hypothetical protein
LSKCRMVFLRDLGRSLLDEFDRFQRGNDSRTLEYHIAVLFKDLRDRNEELGPENGEYLC